MDLANMYRLLCQDAEAIPKRDDGEFYALSFIATTTLTARHPFIQKLRDFRDDPLAWPSLTDELVTLRAPDFWMSTMRNQNRVFVRFGRQAAGDEVPRFPGNAFHLFDAGGKGFLSETCAKLAALCAYELAAKGIGTTNQLEGQAVLGLTQQQQPVTQQEPHSRLTLYAEQLGPLAAVARDDLSGLIEVLGSNPDLDFASLQQIADSIPHRPDNLGGSHRTAHVEFDYDDDEDSPLPKIASASIGRVRLAPAV